MADFFFSPRVCLLSIMLILSAEAVPRRCPPLPQCEGENCPAPTDCVYGTHLDPCLRTVCAKGPGEICGLGMFRMYGSCGDGMICQCGRCLGCSLNTLECFEKTCT